MTRLLVALTVLSWTGCNGAKDETPADSGADTQTPTTDTQTTPVTTSTGAVRVGTILGLTADPTGGADTYARVCQACHGATGQGSLSGADLTERLPDLTPEEVVTTVLDGKGNMDSYASLTNQEVADVVDYVITSFGGGER